MADDRVIKNFPPEGSILDHVGDTPVVRLHPDRWGVEAEIFLKLEHFNPWLSIKDRAAKSMILTAERDGRLTKSTPIVEATTGNTGVSLAAIAAQRGYVITIVMPEYVSRERMVLLAMLGARIELTPAHLGYRETVRRAQELATRTGAFYIDQSNNMANPAAHTETGAEIWAQMQGDIDVFVAGVGTGGHISGVGRYLRARNPDVRVVAVEPQGAALLSGRDSLDSARSTHGILGIGPGAVFATTDRSAITDVFVTTKDDTYRVARDIIRNEGLLVGISSGATLHAALTLARQPELRGKRFLCMAPSQTERYLSTALTDEADAHVDALLSETATSEV
ncbi:cysteine synthase family protein [Rhodovulum sp. FJ3]|uniref:PLP-dependent cysteine synthase family protein n=1 Tax=Rhodovulum sp. FJ3 TaxID=3079053 RepID=UPI00293DFAAB|nr:cysteine synthase family protein [Rhodovulum sp. FJ3]MDV4169583.1 cysteine synthase family protein [Rhodovulum sp. FJ3]